MTMSDTALQREVLDLFVVQSGNIMAELAPLPENSAALAHTLKGSARAIGAFRVADAASLVENAVRAGGDIPKAVASEVLAALSREIDLACAEIANILRGQ